MAESTSYPKVSSNAWRVLRGRASAAPSTKLTSATVAAILDMSSPKSAMDNVVYPMRRLGIIDEDGALTERGQKWRVDGSYADACDEILADVYPSELSSLTDDAGQPDKTKVKTWLQHKGLGESNASQTAATFVMIAERKLPEAQTPSVTSKPGVKPSSASTKKAPKVSAAPKVVDGGEQAPGGEAAPPPRAPSKPDVRLDIQIHIPATASAEQIDQIFASMAKHLYSS